MCWFDVLEAFLVKHIDLVLSLHACCRPRHLRSGAFIYFGVWSWFAAMHECARHVRGMWHSFGWHGMALATSMQRR
jgi:hypothetical protein